jgi:hypothetical protein
MIDEPVGVARPQPAPPANGAKVEDRMTRWRENLARDPWVDECLHILADVK